MSRTVARLWGAAIAAILASLLIVLPSQVANADESMPDLQHPPVNISSYARDIVTSPTGSVTIPCDTSGSGSNLVTYDNSGQLIQELDHTATIDGVTNCITKPVVDQDGSVYGVPSGSGSYGPNLLAYDGNTLKWKYPVACGNQRFVVAGADGNIYATVHTGSDGVHLIGLAPELESGQTQPTKVLDVKIQDDCTSMLYAYKDGIMAHGQNSGNARFYSYGGKFLGQATVGDVWGEKLNADGRLFTSKTIYGSFKSVEISAYDAHTGEVTWSTITSTPGADTNGASLFPLPGGGVLAYITEQKMVSGVPATPTQWVRTLAVLNGNGQKLWSEELPTHHTSGGQYYSTYLAPDTDGNIVMTRDYVVPVTTSSGSTANVPAILIATIDAATGDQTYGEVVVGSLSPTGYYGYTLDGLDYQKVAVSNGTLYFDARCKWNCPNYDHSRKLYAVDVTGLGMDYPRGDILTANTPPQPAPVSYVALGDSFSSGEGVEPFINGTNLSGYNECHRSEQAYSQVLSRDPWQPLDLNSGAFVACSGAETQHVTDGGQWNEGAQTSPLDLNTEIVTITAGGNDIGFKDFSIACILPSTTCMIGSSAYNTALNKINDELPTQLESTYQEILNEAPEAEIYVLGYPHVAPEKEISDPVDVRCSYLYDSGNTTLYWADAQAARAIVTQLNSAIEDAVNDKRASDSDNLRLHYIEVNGEGSPFDGHTVCADSGGSFFLNVDQVSSNPSYVFHPNRNGQRAYAELLLAELTG